MEKKFIVVNANGVLNLNKDQIIQAHVNGNKVLYAGRWYSFSRFKEVDDKGAVIVTPLWKILEDHKDAGQGTCSYALKFKDGNIRFQMRDVCHYRLNLSLEERINKQEVVEIATCFRKYIETHELGNGAKVLAEYIIMHSPWKDCFVKEGKSFEEIWKQGSINMNMDRGINAIASACIALRGVHEFRYKTNMFYMLERAGVNPHVAYLLSRFKGVGDQIYNTLSGAHECINGHMSFNGLKKFFKTGKFIDEGDTYNKIPFEYQIFDSISENNVISLSNVVRNTSLLCNKLSVTNNFGSCTIKSVNGSMDNFIQLGYKLQEEFEKE